jgi:hypothetical protein
MNRVLILIIFLSLISCKKENKAELILGKWKVIEGINYFEGEETKFELNDEYNYYIGSNSDPITFNFTKHNELFWGRKNSIVTTDFEIKNDSIICKKSSSFKIVSLENSELEIVEKIGWKSTDKDNPISKHILTYKLTKLDEN